MNLYSNTLFIDLQNYRPLHAMWDSSIQQWVAGLYVLNFSTLTHSFVFKDFLCGYLEKMGLLKWQIV